MRKAKKNSTEKAVDEARKRHVREARRLLEAEQKMLSKIEKKFGEDVFVRFSGPARSIDCFKTGFPHLDDLLTGETDKNAATVVGTGRGFPRGKVVEISGKEGSGKTTLSLHLCVAAQKAGMRAAFIDAEHAVDLSYAVKLGVDLDFRKWLFNQPSSAEEGLGLLDWLIKERAVGFVVVDSVAALVPEVEVDGDMGDAHVGLQARLMAQALRKIKGLAHENNVDVLFINQLRVKIGGFSRFGPPPMHTTGGNALRYYADVRLDTTVVRGLKKGVRSDGMMSRIKCIKNKLAPPFRDAYMEVRYGRGVVAVHPSDDANAGKEKDGD